MTGEDHGVHNSYTPSSVTNSAKALRRQPTEFANLSGRELSMHVSCRWWLVLALAMEN